MLNSAEHEILNAHTFQGRDKPRMLFSLLINVEMPTGVGIFNFSSRKISCSTELSMDLFITSGPDLGPHLFSNIYCWKCKHIRDSL